MSDCMSLSPCFSLSLSLFYEEGSVSMTVSGFCFRSIKNYIWVSKPCCVARIPLSL